MKILAIETSCDETAIAILRASKNKSPDFELLSNVVASQIQIHQKYGGVYPALAKREHEKNLVLVLKQALKEAKILKSQNSKFKTLEEILERHKELYKNLKSFLKKYQKPAIDVIAVTIGPGLEPCLWTGVNFAKALAFYWDLPIIPINHIEAHIFANFIEGYRISIRQGLFPAICLVVSGGHTQLILMRDFGKYKIIGETRDDAAGECYDKTARILGLPYPGGPAISAEATKQRGGATSLGGPTSIKLPRPMLYSKDYDFSFSGLKTAVLYDFKKRPAKIKKSQKYIQAMAYEIQKAINDVLIHKTIKAAKNFRVKTIILSGGVAANNELRKQSQLTINNQQLTINFLVPPKKFCTDNAAMIAITAYFYLKRCSKSEVEHFKHWEKIKAKANLRLS